MTCPSKEAIIEDSTKFDFQKQNGAFFEKENCAASRSVQRCRLSGESKHLAQERGIADASSGIRLASVR
jgi:hypothetical protein